MYEIELRQYQSSERIHHPEIEKRIPKVTEKSRTHIYLAFSENEEVGLVLVDLFQNVQYLSLYEIFVPAGLRHRGYGSQVLCLVEKLASDLGYNSVALRPEPFENDYDKEKLVSWYTTKGYSWMSPENGSMVKVLG